MGQQKRIESILNKYRQKQQLLSMFSRSDDTDEAKKEEEGAKRLSNIYANIVKDLEFIRDGK